TSGPQLRDGLSFYRPVQDAVRMAVQMARAEAVTIAGVRQGVRVHPRLRRELLESRQRRLRGLDARRDLLTALLLARLAHAEPAQQRRQREALAQQRHKDDGEGDRDDQVASWERCP